MFKGTHATSKKEEHPQDALKTTAIVSNLAECVRVLAPPEVVVDASPFNLGYGQFGNYTGYNPMASNYYLSGGYNNPGANGFNGYSGLQGGYPGLGFSGGGFVGGSFVGGGLSTGYVGLNPNDPGRLTSTGVGNPNGYLPYSTPQTYPAPNYSTPFQTSYYDNAYNNQFQFDPGQSTIIVENACALPVDIRNEPTAGLLVLPPQLSLEPGERRNLQISPGYRLGRFSVTISARAKNSQDPFLEIAQVPVQVRRLGELLDECIQLSSREISLNNFLGKPVPKRIYNYCYDQGVRLLKSSRVIDFSCRVPGVLDEAANPNLEGSPLNADRRLQNASAPAPKGTFAVAQTKHASVAPIDGPIGPPALQPAQGSAAQFQNIFSNQYNPTGYSNAYPATQPAYYGGAATTSGFVGNYATQPGYNTYQSSVDQFGPIGTNPYGQQYFNNWPANGIDNGFYTPPGQGYNGYFPNDSYNAYGGATTSGYYGGYTGGPGYDGDYQGGYLSGAWRNADTYGQPYTDNQSQFAFGNEGQCPLIEDVYVIDEFVTGEGEAGTIQEIEFEIKPDIQYRKQFCRLKADLPFETVFNWRVTASGAYYRSNVDATANIHFLNQFGQWDTKYEHVKLKDTWGIGETIDACIANAEKETAHKRGAPGNCNAPLASCMEPNHLNLQQKYAANGGYVPQELFAGNTADLELVPEALRTGPQLCGEIDGITEVRPTIINHSSGVDVAFNRTQHNIAITIDRRQMKTACAKIEGSVEVLVNRPACFRGPQSATLPYKIWVLAPGKNATDAGVRDGNCVNAPVTPGRPDQNASVTPSPGTAFELQACGENNKGYSGENVRTALGLDKIVWNWDASKINENACSEKGSLENDKAKAIGQFCDAAQFALALDQKAAQLAPVIEKARERQALVTLAEKNAGQPAGAWDNSEQLWRYAYAQAVLPDATQQSDAKAKTLVFFQNADELASDSSAKIPPALARQLESQLRTFASPGGDETSKRVAFIKGLQAVLDKKEDWKSIEDRLLFRLNFDALEIPNDADGKTKTAYRETLSKGLDANTLTGQPGTYYWTLSEMRAFHKALSDTPACLSASASDCKIRIRNADVNVDANFIAKAYAAAVPFIGLPNNATTNENALRTAGATLADNLTQTEYDNARAQLDANVYLMKDGYNSADFKKDVVEKYTLKQFARDWNFTNTNNQTADIDRAGRHAMKLVFDWKGKTQSEKPAVRVQLARTHDLAQLDETLNTGQSDDKKKFHYANNPLFEMPFDGEVGGADRQGYATGFKTAVVENGFGGIKDKLRLKTGINLPKTTGSTTDANASSDANRPAQDSGPLVQPALTLGNKQFNSGTLLELAPNQLRFAPTLALSIRATLGASQQTGLVYAPNNLPDPLGANTRITPLVTWIDSEGKIERADALKAPTGFCDSKNENHSVFTGSSAKNLLGYLFAPAEEDESKAPKYGLNVICARGNATVGGVSIAESKPGVQTQITYAPFSRQELVSGTHITSLEKWLEQIDDARTCTYLTTDGFRTEWNRSNVLEAK